MGESMRCLLSFGIWRPTLRRLPTRGAVALTFDDGPSPETTPRLLDQLAAAKAKATFFVSGVRAVANRDLVAAMIEGGHAVYGHGWEHVHLEYDPQRAVDDMRRVEDELSRLRPTPPVYLLRLPYNAGYARVAMHQAMAAFHPNFQFACWSHSTFDYRIAECCRSPGDLPILCRAAADALRRSRDLDGGIVLMHEKSFGGPPPLNAEVAPVLLPMVLEVLAQRGLRSVTLPPLEAVRPLYRWILPTMSRLPDPFAG